MNKYGYVGSLVVIKNIFKGIVREKLERWFGEEYKYQVKRGYQYCLFFNMSMLLRFILVIYLGGELVIGCQNISIYIFIEIYIKREEILFFFFIGKGVCYIVFKQFENFGKL